MEKNTHERSMGCGEIAQKFRTLAALAEGWVPINDMAIRNHL